MEDSFSEWFIDKTLKFSRSSRDFEGQTKLTRRSQKGNVCLLIYLIHKERQKINTTRFSKDFENGTFQMLPIRGLTIAIVRHFVLWNFRSWAKELLPAIASKFEFIFANTKRSLYTWKRTNFLRTNHTISSSDRTLPIIHRTREMQTNRSENFTLERTDPNILALGIRWPTNESIRSL